MNTRNPLPPLDFLNTLFVLDVGNGVLVRRVTRAPNAQAGDVVGTLDGKGYLHVNILGKFYRLHRIIFYMHNGYEPEFGVDHRDQDRLNNRPGNLRPATDQQNAGNVKRFKHNTSGYRGVSLNSRTGMWHAQIKLWGKQTYLGRYATLEEAAGVYNRAAQEHFGEYAAVPRD